MLFLRCSQATVLSLDSSAFVHLETLPFPALTRKQLCILNPRPPRHPDFSTHPKDPQDITSSSAVASPAFKLPSWHGAFYRWGAVLWPLQGSTAIYHWLPLVYIYACRIPLSSPRINGLIRVYHAFLSDAASNYHVTVSFCLSLSKDLCVFFRGQKDTMCFFLQTMQPSKKRMQNTHLTHVPTSNWLKHKFQLE